MKRILRWWWVLVIIIGIIFGLRSWFNQPSQGVITKAAVPTKTGYDIYEFKGKNFSFKYPSNLEIRKQQDDETSSNVALYGMGMDSTKYNIALRKYTGQFEDDSGIMMRRIKKEQYSEEKVSWNNMNGLVFITKDGSEITGFFDRGGKTLTVSLTGSIGDDSKRENFQKFVEGITF